MSEFIKSMLSEFRNERLRILLILALLFLCYSVYLFLPEGTIVFLNQENAPIELATAFFFFMSSILVFRSYLSGKNIWLLLLGILFFLGAGEELSWGQHIIGFNTPEVLDKSNVQHEFNIHNIEVFNTGNFDRTYKKGWERLLEINFLFRLFCISYGILLPLLASSSLTIKKVTANFRIPVPPLSLGIFFGINWITYKTILSVLPVGHTVEYYEYINEAMEFISSGIFLMIALHFHSSSPKR